jgi:hypothetical protein
MRSSIRCVGAACRVRFLTIALGLVPAAAAEASEIGMEGAEVVVRFDPGEQIQIYHPLRGPSPPFRVAAEAAAGALTATSEVEQPFGIVTPTPAGENPWGLTFRGSGPAARRGRGGPSSVPSPACRASGSSSAPPPGRAVA